MVQILLISTLCLLTLRSHDALMMPRLPLSGLSAQKNKSGTMPTPSSSSHWQVNSRSNPSPAFVKQKKEFDIDEVVGGLKDFDITDVMEEVEEALKVANTKLEQQEPENTISISTQEPQTLVPPVQGQLKVKDNNDDIVASAVGGVVIGLFLGIALLFQIPEDTASEVSLAVPLLGLLVFGLAGTLGASILNDGNNPGGELIRVVFGGIGSSILRVCQAIWDAFVLAARKKVETTTKSIQELPGRIVDTATENIKESAKQTSKSIQELPGNLATAAKENIQETAKQTTKSIQELPGNIATAAKENVKEAAQKTSESIQKKTTQIADDIKATPQRVADQTRQSIEEAVNDLKGGLTEILPVQPNNQNEATSKKDT